MAYLNKEQYEYRREAAAARNVKNESIAVDNGMTEQQADLISRLCSLRHELHCSMDDIVKGNDVAEDIRERFASLEDKMEESGLPEFEYFLGGGDIEATRQMLLDNINDSSCYSIRQYINAEPNEPGDCFDLLGIELEDETQYYHVIERKVLEALPYWCK